MSPWNPRPLVQVFERAAARAVAVGAVDGVKVVSADVERLGFYVFPDGPLTSFSLSPDSSPVYPGVRPFDGQVHVAILQQAYPLLTGQEWYIHNNGGAPYTVYVVEIKRSKEG